MKKLLLLLCILSFQSYSQCETTYITSRCSAKFPGDAKGLRKWMQEHTTYFPKQGKMQASAKFTIDTLGKAVFIEVLSNVQDSAQTGEELRVKTKEIIRLLEAMPAWQPAKHGNNCSYKVCEIHTFYFYFYSKKELKKLKKE